MFTVIAFLPVLESGFFTNFVVAWWVWVRAYLGNITLEASSTDKGQKNQKNNLAVNFGWSLLN